MESRYEEVKNIIRHLQTGYITNRQIVGNERLAFLLVLVIITKRSIPQIVQTCRNQFFQGVKSYKYRGISPRAKNVYYIQLPVSFKEYLEGYCFRYHILEDGLLFPFNPDYVGNRIRELIDLLGYDLSINDIQTLISFRYNTENYQKSVYEFLSMLYEIDLPENYVCFTSDEICEAIHKFIEMYFV